MLSDDHGRMRGKILQVWRLSQSFFVRVDRIKDGIVINQDTFFQLTT